MQKLLAKVFGSRNERLIKSLFKNVEAINALEPRMQALSDEELKGLTPAFRERLAAGTTLDALLPEAFAAVREAGQRAVGMRHFDVQLVGGMVLHQGKIAEMRTGEGKTLVATLAAYLNALAEHGVHIVTVNDYLARRDAAWMGRLYHFLGLRVGAINSSGGRGPDSSSYLFDPDYEDPAEQVQHLRPVTRREAYAADITYGTNNEFGFDYLRDNMALSKQERVQRERHFAIVDEVDSILIDEARTPLIISGPASDSSELYIKINRLIPKLERQETEDGPGDFSVDEKHKQVYLTEAGHQRVEELLAEQGLIEEGDSLYSASNIPLMHHINAALRAHQLYNKDVDYVVSPERQIVIVDEFTGRTMPGRRWSEGLHQAVEAKEGVPIQQENQTLASITFQNFFRIYDKLSGMTGTADTEAYEFQHIYGLEVVVIPTHRPMIRNDMGDLIFLTAEEKFEAIIEDIQDCVSRGQPVLVGTTSIETSEYLSNLLKKRKIKHQVLNAKQHAREAEVIVQAGRPGTVTIATNMAGRGTDIVLGGNLQAELDALGANATDEQIKAVREDWQARHDQVLEAGGLHIIGTERHESRRIDNQLRGRSGRQGDPGSTRFYLSLEDNLMRIFASDRMSGLMQKLGMQHGESIEHPWVTKAIENAQRKVEGHNFDVRKNLLEFDDVANDQRQVIYQQRDELLDNEDVAETVDSLREDVTREIVAEHVPPGSLEEQWDVPGLEAALEKEFGLRLPIGEWLEADHELHEETLVERILEQVRAAYHDKEDGVGASVMRRIEQMLMLQILDQLWKEHLAAMDYLRQGIHLQGYAQRNPKQEYKKQAFAMFSQMLDRYKRELVTTLSRVQVRGAPDVERVEERMSRSTSRQTEHHGAAASAFAGAPALAAAAGGDAAPATAPGGVPSADGEPHQPFVREGRKMGRNEPCHCGSGKKYKHCHGKIEA